MSVFPTCVSVYHVYAVPAEVKKKTWHLLELEANILGGFHVNGSVIFPGLMNVL